jgi:7,8-dihydroneopterin aldolase/epimerase/oxygenase
MTGRIHLKNMVFYGYHGAMAEEGTLGQRWNIDLVLTLDITAAASHDTLQATVDYTKVYNVCRQCVEKDRFKLIESLAGHLIDRILDANPLVETVEIIVRKPSVPIAGILDYVAVETSKSRADRLPRPRQ